MRQQSTSTRLLRPQPLKSNRHLQKLESIIHPLTAKTDLRKEEQRERETRTKLR